MTFATRGCGASGRGASTGWHPAVTGQSLAATSGCQRLVALCLHLRLFLVRPTLASSPSAPIFPCPISCARPLLCPLPSGPFLAPRLPLPHIPLSLPPLADMKKWFSSLASGSGSSKPEKSKDIPTLMAAGAGSTLPSPATPTSKTPSGAPSPTSPRRDSPRAAASSSSSSAKTGKSRRGDQPSPSQSPGQASQAPQQTAPKSAFFASAQAAASAGLNWPERLIDEHTDMSTLTDTEIMRLMEGMDGDVLNKVGAGTTQRRQGPAHLWASRSAATLLGRGLAWPSRLRRSVAPPWMAKPGSKGLRNTRPGSLPMMVRRSPDQRPTCSWRLSAPASAQPPSIILSLTTTSGPVSGRAKS